MNTETTRPLSVQATGRVRSNILRHPVKAVEMLHSRYGIEVPGSFNAAVLEFCSLTAFVKPLARSVAVGLTFICGKNKNNTFPHVPPSEDAQETWEQGMRPGGQVQPGAIGFRPVPA